MCKRDTQLKLTKEISFHEYVFDFSPGPNQDENKIRV